jgi:Predicted phosphatases
MKTALVPSRLRAVVFDFDGTLVSRPYKDFTIMHTRAREALLPFAPDLPPKLTGPILEDIDRICGGLEPDAAFRARQAAMRAIEGVEVETASLCEVFPFVLPMLAFLKTRGIAVGIITRNCPTAVFTAFPSVREHFPCLLTREDVDKVKPHPSHLLRALAMLGCEPGSSLMVGDHSMDIRTGKAAGTYTAGVTGEGDNALRLAEEEPDFLAEDAGEVVRMLFGPEF